MPIIQDRRRFLAGLSAGAASLMGTGRSSAQEGPPETTTVRLAKGVSICTAPQYVADELLRAEGFADIRYVATDAGVPSGLAVARGDLDFTANFAPSLLIPIDAGEPITIVGGEHIGCFELFAREGIRSIPNLKGKNVGVQFLGSPEHLFVSTMAAHVGLDPGKDIRWVTGTASKPMELYAEGKVDAFLGFPPQPQDLRSRGIGRVIVNSVLDRPWSLYFCCMLAGNRDFVRNHPVATKRVLRAIVKAADLCAAEPERVAQRLVEGGFAPRYDFALQSLKQIPYTRWRDYNAEDTIRFYSLRLHEAGMIKSTPNKIIAQGTDWRFFNELKRELKA